MRDSRGWNAVVWLGLAGATVMFGQPANQIKGKVLDETGRAVPAARIRYQRLPLTVQDAGGHWRVAPGEAPVSSQAATDAAGGYSSGQLPSGNYILCADAPGYLSSCEWSGWHRASVRAGELLDLGSVVLIRAATVSIRVEDPLGLISPTSKVPPPLVIGVMDAGDHFHPASQAGADASGRSFQVSVPYGKALRLWVQSWKFRFADEKGTALNDFGAAIPFQVAYNSPGPIFRVRITGAVQARADRP